MFKLHTKHVVYLGASDILQFKHMSPVVNILAKHLNAHKKVLYSTVKHIGVVLYTLGGERKTIG